MLLLASLIALTPATAQDEGGPYRLGTGDEVKIFVFGLDAANGSYALGDGGSISLPLIGAVPAATALIFDTGVFALVVGATVLMLIAIAHQSLRIARLRERDTTPDREAA